MSDPKEQRTSEAVRSTTVSEWECIYCGQPFVGQFPSIPGRCSKRDGTAVNHCFNPVQRTGQAEPKPRSEGEKWTGNLCPLPVGLVLLNAGQRCDMAVGPCACGAWHTWAENRPRHPKWEEHSGWPINEEKDPSLWATIETAFFSAVHRGDPCPFCLARTDNVWPYCVHFSVCVLHDWTEKLAARLDEAVPAKDAGTQDRPDYGMHKDVEEALDHVEAVLRDGEIDLSEVTTPEAALAAQLDLVAHLRDLLLADKPRPETARPVGWARPEARVVSPQGPGKVTCSWSGNKITPDRKVAVLVDGPDLSTWEFFESELAPEGDS